MEGRACQQWRPAQVAAEQHPLLAVYARCMAALPLATVSLASPPRCCRCRLPGVQGDYVMPVGALGFEHLDVKPHKVCGWVGGWPGGWPGAG